MSASQSSQPGLQVIFVAAMDENRALGKEGKVPWDLPDDIQHFRQLTIGQTILMGRKSAEDAGHYLQRRTNLVLSRSRTEPPFPGQIVVHSMGEALDWVAKEGRKQLVVIGGGEVFALALPWATVMELTLVATKVTGADTHFPEYEASEWKETWSEEHSRDARHAVPFIFIRLERIGQGMGAQPRGEEPRREVKWKGTGKLE